MPLALKLRFQFFGSLLAVQAFPIEKQDFS
jgi:hypothetical protein